MLSLSGNSRPTIGLSLHSNSVVQACLITVSLRPPEVDLRHLLKINLLPLVVAAAHPQHPQVHVQDSSDDVWIRVLK